MNQDFEIHNGELITNYGDNEKVVIPDGVTSIGNYAFSRSEKLTSVIIPDSVTSIGNNAFSLCKKLNSVIIPDSVTSIGNFAFYSCKSLKSVIIPDSVTSIGNYAFSRCKKFTSVMIPDSVTSIGDHAFDECTSLISVIIGSNVTSIGNFAFAECRNLTSVNIPDSVTSIGQDVFLYCTELKHTPLMLIEGKMLYEPENRNNIEFSEIRQLVQDHDYSMKMDHDVKYNLIFQMFALGLDEERVSAYIKKNFAKMFRYLIDHENAEIIQKILDSEKFVTKRNIDKHIQYAIDQKKYQIQIMLTDYKQKKNWYQDIDQIANKFKL